MPLGRWLVRYVLYQVWSWIKQQVKWFFGIKDEKVHDDKDNDNDVPVDPYPGGW